MTAPLASHLANYAEWLAARPESGDDYLFSEERVRFELRADDVLAVPENIRVESLSAGVRLSAEFGSDTRAVEVPGVSRSEAERFLQVVQQNPTYSELAGAAATGENVAARFAEAAFGRLLFAPLAVAELERQLSGVEICRFVGSPYEIERVYWENMVAVRRHAAGLAGALASEDRFVEFLRECHLLALLGENRENFYKPASPISRGGAAPGRFLEEPSVTEPRPAGERFVSGPRVNVTLLGGELYHRLLSQRFQDPGLCDSARDFDDSAPSWGRVVTAKADRDEFAQPWFCPPRPTQSAHLEALRGALSRALTAANHRDADALLSALAAAHWQFLHLHPFRCANQSLVMNWLNQLLVEGIGAGMPHLILDHLALRMAQESYVRLFARAASTYLVAADSPAERYQKHSQLKHQLYAFIERLGQAPNLEAAEAVVRDDRDGARAALL